MRINAHAAAMAVSVAAPLFVLQSPVSSVYTDTKFSSMHETQQANETHSSPAKSKTHSKETSKKAKKVTVTIKAGDSLSSIADAHHTTWVRLFNANKQISDPNVIHIGQKLTIPSKDEKLPNRYKKLSSTQLSTMPAVSVGVASAHGGANTYAKGTCTWYVKNMRPGLSNHLGNANAWFENARASGYSTGYTAKKGAVAVSTRVTHVALVTGVSNHGHTVTISEMNYGGAPGVVHTRTVSANNFKYIY